MLSPWLRRGAAAECVGMTNTWDPSQGRLVRPRTDAERERARRLVRQGRIVPIVPGVYAPADAEPSLALKVAAVR